MYLVVCVFELQVCAYTPFTNFILFLHDPYKHALQCSGTV